MHHVVMFSGGAASYVAAKRVIERYGKENVTLLFADTRTEDETLYEFVAQAEKALGLKVTIPVPQARYVDVKDIWDVFFGERMIAHNGIGVCTKNLKQIPCDNWIKRNFPNPDDVTIWVGIDMWEQHRLIGSDKKQGLAKKKLPYVYKSPLFEKPYLVKKDMLNICLADGLDIPELYTLGFEHNNCFAGEERFITSDGIKTFAETAGQPVRVLGLNGVWSGAEVKCFGDQEIVELELQRYGLKKTIRTTENHRWFVREKRTMRKGCLTRDLSPGDRLFSAYAKIHADMVSSPEGIAAGIVFGDGSIESGRGCAKVTLCGEKAELLRYFVSHRFTPVDAGLNIRHLPRAYKAKPDLSESLGYLYGWLQGYFAADGSVGSGELRLSSSSIENLMVVQDVCAILGVATNPITTYKRKGYLSEDTDLHSISFIKSTLRPDFLLRKNHIDSVGLDFFDKKKNPAEWEVVSVKKTGVIEPVYCAVVPGTHEFVLEGNHLTGNCGGFCVKAGKAHFKNLLKTKRARYLYHERREQEFRGFIGKDVSILTDQIRIPGEKKYRKETLTLKQFRERIEAQGEGLLQIDFEDSGGGGCGCFSDGQED